MIFWATSTGDWYEQTKMKILRWLLH